MRVVLEQFPEKGVAGRRVPPLDRRQFGEGHDKSACGFHDAFMFIRQTAEDHQGVGFGQIRVVALTLDICINDDGQGGKSSRQYQQHQLGSDGFKWEALHGDICYHFYQGASILKVNLDRWRSPFL